MAQAGRLGEPTWHRCAHACARAQTHPVINTVGGTSGGKCKPAVDLPLDSSLCCRCKWSLRLHCLYGWYLSTRALCEAAVVMSHRSTDTHLEVLVLTTATTCTPFFARSTTNSYVP